MGNEIDLHDLICKSQKFTEGVLDAVKKLLLFSHIVFHQNV